MQAREAHLEMRIEALKEGLKVRPAPHRTQLSLHPALTAAANAAAVRRTCARG